MHAMPAGQAGWTWTLSGQAFLDGNIQRRKFRDFRQIESQNWLMASLARRVGRGRLRLNLMASFEPFTMRGIGSAQVFQTGETYQGAALVDYQHPHDLVMGAGGTFDWPLGRGFEGHMELAAVGAPALGPAPFMHRPSAADNPTAPLSHHHLDATHVTHGVVTGGVSHGRFEVEASVFHGHEPDENRVAAEFGPLDSYSVRASWRTGAWTAQLSTGDLRRPDPTEATDLQRTTASIEHTGRLHGGPLSWLVAYGVNREPGVHVTSPAWLAEAAWTAAARDQVYSRFEIVKQDTLNAGGYDPPGFVARHPLSWVGALTAGYERRLVSARTGAWGAGADVTVYATSSNLRDGYGHPLSVHAFLHYRFAR